MSDTFGSFTYLLMTTICLMYETTTEGQTSTSASASTSVPTTTTSQQTTPVTIATTVTTAGSQQPTSAIGTSKRKGKQMLNIENYIELKVLTSILWWLM